MKPDNTQETIYVGLDTGLPPYLPYPRFLLKMDISQTAKLLYALLLDRTTLSQRNGWQDDQGRTFIVYPIAEIAEMLDNRHQSRIERTGRSWTSGTETGGIFRSQPPVCEAAAIRTDFRPYDSRKSDPHKCGKPTY